MLNFFNSPFTTDKKICYNIPIVVKEENKSIMSNPIPELAIDNLLNKVKSAMRTRNISADIVNETRIIVIHPEYWEVSLLVPYRNTKAAQIRKTIEDILYNVCNVEERCCDYFGKQKPKESYEWYFRHPDTPQDIYEFLEREIEAELGDEIGMGLPTPSKCKAKDCPAFITVREDVFDQIARGEKTTEYRNLNQYYCDKFLPNGIARKAVKINRGYKSGAENQMTFVISDIVLVSERGDEIPVHDENGKLIVSYAKIPRNFAPAAYGIKLGRRIA